MISSFKLIDKGIIAYQEAWELQEKLLQENILSKLAGKPTTHYFLLCEHPPVYTLGRNGKKEHLLINEADLQQKGIDFFYTNRGGDITFHGLGQIVGYLICDLENISTSTNLTAYLRNMEEVIIQTIAEYDIQGERSKGETGVWIDPHNQLKARKICAIGIRCSRWITMHGFALNVNTALDYFNHIIPCGIPHKQVTSMQKELQQTIPINPIKKIIAKKVEQIIFKP